MWDTPECCEGTIYNDVFDEKRGVITDPLLIFTASTTILHVELLKIMYIIYITRLISKNQAFVL